MTLKLMLPALTALTLAGCGGGGHPIEPVSAAASASGGMAARPAGPVGFIGPDGLVADAPPDVGHALDTAIRNQPVSWTDPESGSVTEVTALRTFQRDDNSYCRDFTETVSLKGETTTARGTACRDSSGNWSAVAAG